MKKINIAELLKDCPKGMELDCTIFDNVTFERVAHSGIWINYVNDKNHKYDVYLDNEGCLPVSSLNLKTTKCVIFPKGKTTWDGFVPPHQFKDGDIVATEIGSIFIYNKSLNSPDYFGCYVGLSCRSRQSNIIIADEFTSKTSNLHLATEEEKKKLFEAIKANGYKWNEETKTLEKLIKPIFKVGDKVQWKEGIREKRIIDNVLNDCYTVQGYGVIFFTAQDEWELAPNKFDITTLKPFESKVLVRNANGDLWKPAEYGFSYSKGHYVVGGIYWKQCIPYKGNEHLLRKTDDCNEYYKTWK